MALRTTVPEATFEIWKLNCDALATDVGDLALLTANVTTSVIASLNDIQAQIDAVIVGAFTLSNNVWFVGNGNPSGTVNVFRVNTANKIEFGAQVASIDITGGTITSLTSPIPKTAGGTGGIDNTSAQTSLGLLIGTNVQAYSARLGDIASLGVTLNNVIVANGTNWIANTPAQFKTAMGLTVGTDVQAWNVKLDAIASIIPNSDTFIAGNGSTWVNKDPSAVRAILALVVGTNVQAYNANLSNISSIGTPTDTYIMSSSAGVWSAKSPTSIRTDLGLVIGTNVQAYSALLAGIASQPATSNYTLIGNGTNYIANSPLNARSALGLAIGTDVQAQSTHLQQLHGLSKAVNNLVMGDGTTYQSLTPASAKTALSLTTGTHIQAWSARLDSISALTPSVDNFLVGNGSAWVLTSGATARASLGVIIGTNVQAYHAYLQQISGLSPSTNGIIVWNGSAWVTQVGATARSSLGVAQSGANADITSLSRIGGDFKTIANTITFSPANGVDCWTFDSAGHLMAVGGVLRDIGGAGSGYPRNIYASQFLPVARPTDYNLSAFGYTRRVSLNAPSATTQQVAEFALSVADDLQAIGIFGGI